MSMGSSGDASSDPMMSSGFSDVGGGGGISQLLQGLLKDPQMMKELGSLGSKLGSTIEAGNKLSPGTRQMLQQATQGQQRPKRDISPFVGDMLQYITPEMAKSTLNELGIPSSRAML